APLRPLAMPSSIDAIKLADQPNGVNPPPSIFQRPRHLHRLLRLRKAPARVTIVSDTFVFMQPLEVVLTQDVDGSGVGQEVGARLFAVQSLGYGHFLRHAQPQGQVVREAGLVDEELSGLMK